MAESFSWSVIATLSPFLSFYFYLFWAARRLNFPNLRKHHTQFQIPLTDNFGISAGAVGLSATTPRGGGWE